MSYLSPSLWKDYELIDSGGLEKLERFGPWFLARPEPQAVWQKALPAAEWEKRVHAWFRRRKGSDPAKGDFTEKGEWQRLKPMPDQWVIDYPGAGFHLKFRLGLTAFGHIGVFPEQAVNWEWIGMAEWRNGGMAEWRSGGTAEWRSGGVAEWRVLNLFAYTGGASLAAKAAGADVVHVDSVKPVVSWARENMELSGLTGIRWVVEDAMKFARREVSRGNRYDGIILDPPAYGRGPDGEKWILQEGIDELMGHCSKLLKQEHSFLIFSLYSMGFSALIAENLVRQHFGDSGAIDSGELYIPDSYGRKLPLGTYLRMKRSAEMPSASSIPSPVRK